MAGSSSEAYEAYEAYEASGSSEASEVSEVSEASESFAASDSFAAPERALKLQARNSAAFWSAMSMMTTSASAFSAIDRATVAPTLPAPPTTVTLRFINESS